MNVDGKATQTIFFDENKTNQFQVIDQRQLPHRFVIEDIKTVQEAADAIEDMHVRGAPLIGVTAAFGMVIAVQEASSDGDYKQNIKTFADQLVATRPTAVNLAWAVERQMKVIEQQDTKETIIAEVIKEAIKIKDEDVQMSKSLGEHGLGLIKTLHEKHNRKINILTHCNAGWLATVDWGTATSPIYHAFEADIPIHVWVDETRPRNQGAKLTAWELGQHGVEHTLIADNTGGHLMQHGMVDICIVGTDRTTRTGDVANKIGTYLKALAAHDNNIPFYVALPSSTIDWTIRDGLKEIPIEQRSQDEVRIMDGMSKDGLNEILICPESSPAVNYGFDVTPSRFVTGLITERGVCEANEASMTELFPEFKN